MNSLVKQYKNIDWTKISLITTLITFTIIFTVKIGIKIWSLNKGLSMNDDGWYLILLRDLPTEMAITNYFKYFHNIWNGDILNIRITVFSLDLLSSLIFSFGLFFFNKKKYNLNNIHFLLLFFLTYIGFNLSTPPLFGVYSYVTLNRQLTLISFGFLLYALQTDNKFLKNTLVLVSGILIGSLFFIMITNVPIFLVIILFIFYYERKMNRICIFFMGMILSSIYYFLFVESFGIFLNNFVELFTKTTSGTMPKGYGIEAMIKWFIYIFYYGFIYYLMPALSIIGLVYISKRNKILTVIFLLSFFTTLAYYFFNNVFYINQYCSGISSFDPIYIFLIATLTIGLIEHKQSIDVYFLVLLLSVTTPIFLTLGTIISYNIRVTEYSMFILPAIYLSLFNLRYESDKAKLVYSILILFYSFNSFYFLNKENWATLVYTKQNTSLKSIGIDQDIYLDKTKANELWLLKKITNDKSKIIASNQSLWAYVYLLNKKPSDYNFRIIISAQDSASYDCVYLEDNEYPFDEKMKSKLLNNKVITHKIGTHLNAYTIQ